MTYLRVMISSTVRDLPEHRKQAMDACLRQGMFPVMMEHLPAGNDEAIPASLKMVDEADIYLLILGRQYGSIPDANNPQRISVTEHEYNRALEREMPILTFVMHEDHVREAGDGEKGERAVKFEALKRRAMLKGTNFFKSPADLRADIINSLSYHRKTDPRQLHYVGAIPKPPEPYIAHPYTLLQTSTLIGRQHELKLLTGWITGKQFERGDLVINDSVRIMSVVAIGGIGKSALTWHWFNDVAPKVMQPLAGLMWWSFYESNATFENFVAHALAYVSRRRLDEVERIPVPEREAQLLAGLRSEPYLIVLDGLERLLIAYARPDAAHLIDDRMDTETGNFVLDAYGRPPNETQSFRGDNRLRKTIDPRAGAFLRKLSGFGATRVLISTRIYPEDLQTVTRNPLPGCAAMFLEGLRSLDALALWRVLGVSGEGHSLLPFFDVFENHALLIQVLARRVACYRPAPGDFEQWRSDHPDFDPFSLPAVQVKSHVLSFALRGLDDRQRQVLRIIAAFRMPADYDTLAALLIGEGKSCAGETELDLVLTELEDRGLVGWDKRANRYDLHPIVRGVVWNGLADETRREVYGALQSYFEALPNISNWRSVKGLDELAPTIELYNTLIGLERYDDAERIFVDKLDQAMLYCLGANRERVELLEMLFPDGLDQLPKPPRPDAQGFILNALGAGYFRTGQPKRAVPMFHRACTIYVDMQRNDFLRVTLCNLSGTLQKAGMLRESELTARHAIRISREQQSEPQEAIGLVWLGATLAAQGRTQEAEAALQRALRIFLAKSRKQWEPFVMCGLAQNALWSKQFEAALSLANRAWELEKVRNDHVGVVRAIRLQGEAALALGDFAVSDERLHDALIGARMVSLIDEELPAIIALAELRWRQGDSTAARGLLDDVWEASERGPYPLFHCDAYNVLAQIERDDNNMEAAVEAAAKAYRYAWCDGPPFSYHGGRVKANQQLQELGAEPELPPTDAAAFEPMPEVEIDPHDEFHAADTALCP